MSNINSKESLKLLVCLTFIFQANFSLGQVPANVDSVDLLFNGLKKDRIYATKEWLSKLDSIVVMNPNCKLELFRVSSCCEGIEYEEYASQRNKLTSGMKAMFNRAPVGCKFYFGMFDIKDKDGNNIPTKHKDYTIVLVKK